MNFEVAIHKSDACFTNAWLDICEIKNIKFKLVNCFDNNIIDQIRGCKLLLWHHTQDDYRDLLLAKDILIAISLMGVRVFPDYHTNWHFDNKVAQKYLLEALSIPMVRSYVFCEKNSAQEWLESATYPLVFKLRGGAGSSNVMLAKNKKQATKYVSKSFGGGWPPVNKWHRLKDSFLGLSKGNVEGFVKSILRLVIPNVDARLVPREAGYAYFQDFIPNNDSDIRVIIIGEKAFAIKRLVRDGDFRASGSGKIVYERNAIDLRCIGIAFQSSSKIGAQCLAFDFVFDVHGNPLVVEVSYGFSLAGYIDCSGYWDKDLTWHGGSVSPCEWILDGLLKD